MSGSFWRPDEEDTLVKLYQAGRTYGEIARHLGRSRDAVMNKRSGMGLVRAVGHIPLASLSRTVRDDSDIQIVAPVETGGESADAFLERALRQTSQKRSKLKAERFVKLRISTASPVAVGITSDWHLTATGPCDVNGVLEMVDSFRETPGAYLLGAGDMTDNPIKHRPTSIADIPDDVRLLDIVLGRAGGKLLGCTSGNHDDWSEAFAGLDHLQSMTKKHKIHYAPDELVWIIEIVHPRTKEVTASWVIATRHKFRRHSNLNHTHACWRWLEENMHNWPVDEKGRSLIPDVVAIGHNHVAACETRTYERGDVIACRMGSFQYTSRFTRAGGWTLMPATVPTVILPPKRGNGEQPVAYERYEHALKALAPPKKARR